MTLLVLLVNAEKPKALNNNLLNLSTQHGKTNRGATPATTLDVAIRVRDVDTSSIWSMSSLGGFPVMGVVLTSDSADEAEMHSQLAEELEEISEPVLTTMDGVITYMNKAAERDLGWRPTDLLGEKLTRRLVRREDLNSVPEKNGLLQVQQVHALRKTRTRKQYLMAAEQNEGIIALTQQSLHQAHSAVHMCTVLGGGRALTLRVNLRRDPTRLWHDEEESLVVDGFAHMLAVPADRIDVRVADVEDDGMGDANHHVQEFEDSEGNSDEEDEIAEDDHDDHEDEVLSGLLSVEEEEDEDTMDSATQASSLSSRTYMTLALPKSRMVRAQV